MPDIKLQDFIKIVENDLGKTEWVTVFEFLDDGEIVDRGAYFSALIANTKVKEVLSSYNWDLRIGSGRPGFTTYYMKDRKITKYQRFSDKGIEPLVYWRTFSGKDTSYCEISEEFRLYFDLFEKNLGQEKKVFTYTDNNGEEEEVILIDHLKVQIKLRCLKEYITVKKMHLAIYFEAMRFLPESLTELSITPLDQNKSASDFHYSLCVRDLARGDTQSQGWLLGKKLIAGLKKFQPSDNLESNNTYEDFIVGVDEDGKEKLATCNTDYQGNPGFLTPIFFKREVLKKYYDNPDKYTVEDSHIKKDGFWGLRVLNNHTEHVIVWLGDLKMIPYKEQQHWREFNITPSHNKISHTDFARNINGEFTDPEHPELYFKYKFNQVQDKWFKKYGWHLFQPLASGDLHHIKSLHVPVGNSQKEFDDQVASVTKIMIDSLNEKELQKGVTITKESPKGIDKFEAFMRHNGFNVPKMLEFFRNLQQLRSSSVAHRKGKTYEKLKVSFEIGDKELAAVFEEILIKCVYTLNTLERLFLTPTE